MNNIYGISLPLSSIISFFIKSFKIFVIKKLNSFYITAYSTSCLNFLISWWSKEIDESISFFQFSSFNIFIFSFFIKSFLQRWYNFQNVNKVIDKGEQNIWYFCWWVIKFRNSSMKISNKFFIFSNNLFLLFLRLLNHTLKSFFIHCNTY